MFQSSMEEQNCTANQKGKSKLYCTMRTTDCMFSTERQTACSVRERQTACSVPAEMFPSRVFTYVALQKKCEDQTKQDAETNNPLAILILVLIEQTNDRLDMLPELEIGLWKSHQCAKERSVTHAVTHHEMRN